MFLCTISSLYFLAYVFSRMFSFFWTTSLSNEVTWSIPLQLYGQKNVLTCLGILIDQVPLANGFLLFNKSNAKSTFLIKSVVASLPKIFHLWLFVEKVNSSSYWRAQCLYRLTFILCLVHSMCWFFSLFAKENPKFLYSVQSSMYHQRISSNLPFCSKLLSYATRRFLRSFTMWQTSKMTWIFLSVSGWRNHVCRSDTDILHSLTAVLWFVKDPSKTKATTLSFSAVRRPMQSLINCACTEADILFWRK